MSLVFGQTSSHVLFRLRLGTTAVFCVSMPVITIKLRFRFRCGNSSLKSGTGSGFTQHSKNPKHVEQANLIIDAKESRSLPLSSSIFLSLVSDVTIVCYSERARHLTRELKRCACVSFSGLKLKTKFRPNWRFNFGFGNFNQIFYRNIGENNSNLPHCGQTPIREVFKIELTHRCCALFSL